MVCRSAAPSRSARKSTLSRSERTEYQVVGDGKLSQMEIVMGGSPIALERAEREAAARIDDGYTNVRIQTRTVTETPWADLTASSKEVGGDGE